MKPVTIAFVLSIVSFVSCDATASKRKSHSHHNHDHSTMHHTNSKKMESTETNKSITDVIDNYLSLKDALVKSDSKKAAESAESLLVAIKKFKSPSLEEKEAKKIEEIIESAFEQADHISKNDNDIDHQREHLEVLSTDLKDLIDMVGSDRVLYRQYCPMALDGKGAYWLSNSDKIRNPYFGNMMLKCGSVKQTIKPSAY